MSKSVRKNIVGKLAALAVALLLMLVAGACGGPETVSPAADARQEALSGTYIELFPEFVREEYRDYWLECIQAYPVDEASAEDYYTMLTQMCMGRLYGQEAVDAYGGDPSSMVFDCYFENDIAELTIDGSVISAVDGEGKELFRHAYSYAQDVPVIYFGEEMPTALHVYKTEDADAGAFTYFAFSDDVPDETWHIEFCYGETLEGLGNCTEGPYAYWLAGGIRADYSEDEIKDCIKLFVDENVGEQFAEVEVIEIDSAASLAAVADDLSGHYVLTADIDLSGVEWTPLGAFVPSGESEEEQEIPDPEQAFTGTFDGQGHTISNLTVGRPEDMAVGLFGCIANADVGNFTLENATADGTIMVADVVGYAYCSTVHDVKLTGGKVTAHSSDMSGEGMYGGVVGAGMSSLISGCEAEAQLLLPDDTANAGIVGGGLEMTSLVDCRAGGSISTGNNCYGVGAVSGCGFAAEEFTRCTAENVSITLGDGCFWIGGVTGYCGGYADASFGMPVTVLTDCRALNVSVSAGAGAEGVGDIVGSGFYNEEVAAAMGAPFDKPTEFRIVNCSAEPAIAQ